ARESGANFVTPGALAAVRARLAAPEKHQTLKEDRLWADLLSSMPLCFNLFGDLAGDADACRKSMRTWWPDAPDGESRVRFEHSPGRRDPAFLGNKSAFDVAFEIRASVASADTRAIVGVETKYHEHARKEDPPEDEALARYVEVTERSGIFVDGWRERVVGTPLQQIWLDHLLVLAMLQHPSKQWTWGRFVLVYPSANPSFAAAASRYRETLVTSDTFEARMIEDLLAAGTLADGVVAAIRERYVDSP
ncbi:MAG TPA: hypothetical protein VF765_09630, partial [Polyangiaceae bacterium]